MKTVYGVWANRDNVEGRGPDELKYLCATDELGKRLAKNLGPMGMSDGDVRPMYVLESIEERDQPRKKEKLDALLKRLTPEELTLLKTHLT